MSDTTQFFLFFYLTIAILALAVAIVVYPTLKRDIRKKQLLRKLIGNLFLLFAILLFTFVYLPYIYSFFPTTNYQLPTSNYISIPRINALAPVIKNVDPWNAKEYKEALKKGVAQAKDFPNFYFAHSSLPPWEMTRTNTAFLRLGELEKGDEIIITKDGQEKRYKVTGKKEVWPNEVSAIQQQGDEIILQTCSPVGTDLKRLLVFAKPV